MIRPINIPSTTYYISNLLPNAQCVKNGIIIRVEIFFKNFTSQSLAHLCAEWQQESQSLPNVSLTYGAYNNNKNGIL